MPRMCVAAPFSAVLWRRSEVTQKDLPLGRYVIQVHMLNASLWVSVVKDPVSIRQVGAMSIARHGLLADDFDLSIAAVFKQIETDTMCSLIRQRQNVSWIAPHKVGS